MAMWFMKPALYKLANGNKYFMKDTNAPRLAFLIYQQQISQKTGMWKIHFSCKSENNCDREIWIDFVYIQNMV